jgi:3-vinyl bacteriochlorophyllide hydratase
VQAILAPAQFAVFLVSLGLVVHYLGTGMGWKAAAWSVVAKTVVLYVIMLTGALWERDVFGRFLFAPNFFWEDVVSLLVLALHTLYLAGLFLAWFRADQLMVIALAGYAFYLANAAQFLLKFSRGRTPHHEPGPVAA